MPGMSLGMGTFLGGLATGIGSIFGGSQQSSAAPTNIPGQQNLTPGQQFAGQAGNALGAAGGDWLSNMMAERQQDRQMKKASQNQIDSTRKYFNELFPNTNEWERLGASSPAGAQITSANTQARSAERIANIQARTAKDVALIQTSPAHRQAETARRQLDEVQLKQLHPNIQNVKQDTKLKVLQGITEMVKADLTANQSEIARVQASYQGELSRAGIRTQNMHNVGSAVSAMIREEGNVYPAAAMLAKELGIPLVQAVTALKSAAKVKQGLDGIFDSGSAPVNSQTAKRGPNMSGM